MKKRRNLVPIFAITHPLFLFLTMVLHVGLIVIVSVSTQSNLKEAYALKYDTSVSQFSFMVCLCLKLCEQKTDWLKDLILSVINDFFKKIWVNLRQGMEDYTLNLLFPKLSIVEAEVNIMFFFNSSSLFHFLRNEFPDYLYKYWTSMSNLNYKG